MPVAASSNAFLKSLIIMGIVAACAFAWLSVNLETDTIPAEISRFLDFGDKFSLKKPSSEHNKSPEKEMFLPEELRASANVDWSILYGDDELSRNQVAAAILEASQVSEIDANLLRAVIMAESVFDGEAVSRAGARGLMQLMPGTARDLGVIDVHNSRENILAGARYLSFLLDEFNGDIHLAIAAYRVGPQTIHRSNNSVPNDIVPYVARVMCYWRFFAGPKKE